MDKLFLDLVNGVKHDFTGWDFTSMTGTGRIDSGLLSWSYGSLAIPLVRSAGTLLDMGTGGGEILSMLGPLPDQVYATESYAPNVPVARQRLEPLGVEVIQLEPWQDSDLPFADKQFDLILNKHEIYCPVEMSRIITDDGIFLTQQSGGQDCRELNEYFGVPLNEEFSGWNLDRAVEGLRANGFDIIMGKEEFIPQRFYDIGSLIYYLKATPWQVPGFEQNLYLEKLYEIHRIIGEKGYFETTQHRFIIKARLA
ncbi:class I SAM-dependent methyltransferase [Paenibacillus sp. GbtcB18]|uniref:class I SAM-dependent methyltransferase n=1 Tax=Paenibacillus sp. GbtcB18 TaxID=2824763 RepID=UPI001C3009EF|nr:class I SAM-dependent methyltransferase [Paenibacillus sp. GbtcB18]